MADSISSTPLGNDPINSNEPDFVAQLGRISGKLLSENLIRHGVDLTFRNGPTDPDLLYLNVTDLRIGINNETPVKDLDVSGSTKTDNIIITTKADLANIGVHADGYFFSTTGPIIIQPDQSTDPVLNFNRVITDDIEIKGNLIKNYRLSGDLELEPSGIGKIQLLSNTDVDGDLDVSGNINIDGNLSKQGNLTIGDQPTDIVIIGTDFTQDIIPGTDNIYNLGSPDKNWNRIYVNDMPLALFNVGQFVSISNQLAIDGNNRRIFSLQSNEDVTLLPDSGSTIIQDIKWTGSDIINLDSSNPTIISNTGIGYTVFGGTNSMIIPAGTTAEQRPFPEVGETRWNTDLEYLECFDGTTWIISTGPGQLILQEDMEELGHVYTLMLG
jgi:hypothetical protein